MGLQNERQQQPREAVRSDVSRERDARAVTLWLQPIFELPGNAARGIAEAEAAGRIVTPHLRNRLPDLAHEIERDQHLPAARRRAGADELQALDQRHPSRCVAEIRHEAEDVFRRPADVGGMGE